MNENKVFQEVDALQVVKRIGTTSKRVQAKILQRLELSMDKDSEDFAEIRKLILDELNNLNRTVVRDIFGDIEYLISNR